MIIYGYKDTRDGYEKDLDQAESLGLTVHESYSFRSNLDGMVCGDEVYLSEELSTKAQKRQVLDEEIVHYKRDSGNITDLSKEENRRQEVRARRSVIKKLVPIDKLLQAILDLKENATPFALARKLEVEEPLIDDVLQYYSKRYETSIIGGYLIRFVPLRIVPCTKEELFRNENC